MRLFKVFVLGLFVLSGQQAQANIFSDWWTKIKSWFCPDEKVLMERAEQQEQRAREEIEALESKKAATEHEHKGANEPAVNHDQSAPVPHDEGQGYGYGQAQPADSQESTAHSGQ
ncbi:MAG: hypothetical protein LBL30_04625 [Holosporales bacterium]|nr:hypothetical protein [Holosporales bacterium]